MHISIHYWEHGLNILEEEHMINVIKGLSLSGLLPVSLQEQTFSFCEGHMLINYKEHGFNILEAKHVLKVIKVLS